MSAARAFHLTPADAIRDALELLGAMGDGEDYNDDILSGLAPVEAALIEALELLGERP